MSEQTIRIYGVEWCGDCIRTRRFLNKNEIEYQWINIDRDKAGEQIVMTLNNGMRSVPTIIFGDGSKLVEPSTTTLAEKLGINGYR